MAEAAAEDGLDSPDDSENSQSSGEESLHSGHEAPRRRSSQAVSLAYVKPEWDNAIIEACEFYGYAAYACYLKKGGEYNAHVDSQPHRPHPHSLS